MKIKHLFLVSLSSLLFVFCKSGPDKALVEQMKADIAKYEPAIPPLQQFSTEMREMGGVILGLPEEVKKNVPHYNEEEAQMWAKMGGKMQAGVDDYNKKLNLLKLLTADYMDGKLPKDSAQISFTAYRSTLMTIPDMKMLNEELNRAKGSYQQMIAVVPDSTVALIKAKLELTPKE